MQEYFQLGDGLSVVPEDITIRASGICPHCLHKTIFERVGADDKLCQYLGRERKREHAYIYSIRRCPGCKGGVFLIAYMARIGAELEIRAIYPERKIRWQSEGYPEMISSSLNKAIFNYEHGHYDTAAIMLRKAIEQICDEAGASRNKLLGQKIQELEKQLILPKEILEGIRELSYLGNDAVHVDARTFQDVGKPEVEVGIELATEIVRSLYFYKTIISRLRSLKKQSE